MPFQIHPSFSEVIDSYDGFILDQFGVLHNGSRGLEGAPELVSELAKRGKKLIILSNSSSASESTRAKLPKLGFDPNDFCGAVTSGEEAARHIAGEFTGKRAVFFTWKTPKTPSPMTFLELCGGIDVVGDPSEADFVILHGVDVLRGPGSDGEAEETPLGGFNQEGKFDAIDPVLRKCADANLPMVWAEDPRLELKMFL